MITHKPWGSEELIETNENYTVKKLIMLSGQKCSLQYHEYKHETFFVVSGKLRFYYGDSIDTLVSLELGPGSFFVIPPKLIHRMEGIDDTVYIEASTSQLQDVVRLEDSYGRK